jgi:hypothetical protein
MGVVSILDAQVIGSGECIVTKRQLGIGEMRGNALGLAFVGALVCSVLGLLGGALDREIEPHKAGDFGASVFLCGSPVWRLYWACCSDGVGNDTCQRPRRQHSDSKLAGLGI